jgi:hypothetical protein
MTFDWIYTGPVAWYESLWFFLIVAIAFVVLATLGIEHGVSYLYHHLSIHLT